MKGIPTELLFALGVAAFALFQYLMRRFRRQHPPRAATVERVPKNAGPVLETTPGGSTPAVRDPPAGRVAAPHSVAAIGKRRLTYGSLLRTRGDVRNAMVTATILGPCRAFDPSS